MLRAQPRLIRVNLEKLHPTQITVGKEEVALKRKEWGKLSKKVRAATLNQHWFPSVSGPEGKYYIVDHHHFGLALLQEDVKNVWLLVLKDLYYLDISNFWIVMDHHQWVHPYDSRGLRREFHVVPTHLEQLQDDPYRSLAGELRRAGGFAKDIMPFTEFLWADFLRKRISSDSVKQNFAKAIAKARKLAHGQDARYLPGWTGVIVPQ